MFYIYYHDEETGLVLTQGQKNETFFPPTKIGRVKNAGEAFCMAAEHNEKETGIKGACIMVRKLK